jgi:hypothetical protein
MNNNEENEDECLLMAEILAVEVEEDCFECREGNGDCVLQEIEMRLMETGAVAFNESVLTTEKDNNARARYAMYRYYIAIVEGYLGKGKRVRLPRCVEVWIKKTFPDPDGKFTGYKET